MKHYSGAVPALALRAEPEEVSAVPASIRASLLRIHAMGMAWDEAADALSRRDIPAFDQAMSKFREASAKEPEQ